MRFKNVFMWFLFLRKKGGKKKKRMKEEEIEKGYCRPPTRKVFFERMVWWCIRRTRLTLICEVIRYRLVQVRQNLKKRFFMWVHSSFLHVWCLSPLVLFLVPPTITAATTMFEVFQGGNVTFAYTVEDPVNPAIIPEHVRWLDSSGAEIVDRAPGSEMSAVWLDSSGAEIVDRAPGSEMSGRQLSTDQRMLSIIDVQPEDNTVFTVTVDNGVAPASTLVFSLTVYGEWLTARPLLSEYLPCACVKSPHLLFSQSLVKSTSKTA